MNAPSRSVLLAALPLLLVAARDAAAVTLDGQRDPAYGPALTTQASQTNATDSSLGRLDQANGSELDAAYGFIADGVLHLFLSGNLHYQPGAELLGHWNPVDVFVDAVPGGQHQLLDSNPSIEANWDLNQLAGLTFEAGFEADYWFGFGARWFSPLLRVYAADLPAGGFGSGDFLGIATPGGPGALTGGFNPFGVLATIDDRNVGGVGGGCAAAAPADVTTGLEVAIPLAAIGNPAGCVRVCAFVSSQDHGQVTNQALGALPAGYCGAVASGTVDFSAIAGDQSFAVCLGTAGAGDRPPVPRATLAAPGPNPASRGARLGYALPATLAGRAFELSVVDLGGRRVRTLAAGIASAGRFAADWDLRDAHGARVGAGVYFVRLRVGGDEQAQRIAVVH